MAKKQAAFLLLGHGTAETEYGAGVDNAELVKWYRTEDPPLMEYGGEEETDENEVKGYTGVSEDGDDVLKTRGSLSLVMKPNLEMLGHALMSVIGTGLKTGAADPFSYAFKQPTTAVERPKSFSAITAEDRYVTSTFKKHNGVFVNTLEAEWTQANPAGSMTLGLVTDGAPVDASAVAPPAIGTALKGTRIRFNHWAFMFGPQGAAVDIASKVRSIKLSATADTQEEQRSNRGTALGTIFHGEQAPSVSMEIVVEGKEGDTIYQYWENRTLLELLFTATVAANRTFTINADAVKIPLDVGKIADVENGIVPILTLPLRLQFKEALASNFELTVQNAVPAYLE